MPARRSPVRTLRIDLFTCGCYLHDPENVERVCGQSTRVALVYGGLPFPICYQCAVELAAAHQGKRQQGHDEANKERTTNG